VTSSGTFDPDSRERTAVVTGAGGGIGAAVAQRPVRARYSVLSIDLRFPHASSRWCAASRAGLTEGGTTSRNCRFRPVDSVHVIVNAAAVRPTGSIFRLIHVNGSAASRST